MVDKCKHCACAVVVGQMSEGTLCIHCVHVQVKIIFLRELFVPGKLTHYFIMYKKVQTQIKSFLSKKNIQVGSVKKILKQMSNV